VALTFKEPHAAGWNAADFFLADTLLLPAGVFSEVGRRPVVAGLGHSLGFGDLAGQHNAIGRIFADMQSNLGALINGDFRLDVHDAMDRPVLCLFEARTEQLRTNVADRTMQRPFPEIKTIISEDANVVLKFRPDVATIVGYPESVIHMDVTDWTKVVG
jgi:hypothetical protein